MVETRHVKLDYEESLNAKKQLLSTELNLLQVIKRLKNYKDLRKKELVTKNQLKTSLSSLKTKINLIQSAFPQEKKIKLRKKTQRIEKEKTSNLQSELEEIRRKLAKLGK